MKFRPTAAVLVLAAACGGAALTPKAPPPPNTSGWWRDKAVYEIFVRSFADSDGDGIGDLKGLTAHLDYLNGTSGLGVDAVWLMPIFPSPSYHGYDVSDYRSVNPKYGTLDDFDALVKAAHQRGIKVVLDMVLNHSSSQHPWFVNSLQGKDALKRNWYDWADADPGWRQPWNSSAPAWHQLNGAWFYSLFCSCMPDLNLANPAVEQEMTASMKFWLDRGVDGFRLDAARYFFASGPGAGMIDQPGTHAFLKRIRAALQADHPQTLFVAEAWAALEIADSYYGSGDEVQLAFSFDLADAIKSAATSGDSSGVVNVLARSEAALTGKDRGFEAPFLSNHDQVRVMRALNADAGATRVAAALLLALPGTPFIYYGEEIGMQGGAGYDDRDKRTPMRWTADAASYNGFTSGTPWYSAGEAAGIDVATEQADPNSLWNEYRRLLAVRHAQAALATGDATRPAVSGGGAGVIALLRTAGTARALFVANFGTAASGAFTVDAAGTPNPLASEGLTAPPTAASGKLSFAGLAPRSFAYFALN